MPDETKKSGGKVFDISSKVSAAPNSRSVIVGHGPILHDPTIVEEQDESGEGEAKAPKEGKSVGAAHQIVIKPLDDDVKPEPDTKEEATQKDEPPAITEDSAKKEEAVSEKDSARPEVEQPKEGDKPKAEARADATPAGKDESRDELKADGPDTPPHNAVEEQKKEEAASQAAIEHGQHIAELVASEQYFLPINQVKQRKNQRFLIVGGIVCILLAVAWLDVALDAGLVSNSYNLPHTHFFAVKP